MRAVAAAPEQRLCAALATLQLGLHAWQALAARDPRLWVPHAVAAAGDLAILGAIVAAAAVARRGLPDRLRPVVARGAISGLLIAGALLAVYPALLREYLAFPVDLFATDGASARVLVTEYLGVSRLWPAALALVVGSAALALPLRLPVVGRSRFVLWAIALAVAIATLPRSPNPLLYSLQAEAMRAVRSEPRVVPALRRPPSRAGAIAARSGVPTSIAGPLVADHVFLVVLEGVTAASFERELWAAQDGFAARTRERAVYFRNYHATNLDSYTSLIAMLTGVQVPYRAYADDRLYDAVNDADNLVRSLRRDGFFAVFVSTYEHQPFVPNRRDWDRVLDRTDLPSLEGWVSLGASRMEAATEDRAALSTILDAAAVHPRTLVLHELLYGHSPEWRARTGRSQLAYYDLYLTDLLDRIVARGLETRSLIVVVSDHGDRARSAEAENYRVPLLVVGSAVAPGEDAGFRSHLDLADIVASYLRGSRELPRVRAELDVVGSTERWVYGSLRADGSSLFLDDATGSVLAEQGGLEPRSVAAGFQARLDEFGRRFGR